MPLLLDSVFSPLLADPYPDDRPLIPVDEIEQALDQIEADSATAQQQILTQEIQRVLDRSVPLLRVGDIDGINALTWAAGFRLQQPIIDAWQRGFVLGGQQMIAEMQAAIPDEYRFALIPRLIEAVKRLLGLQPKELPPDSPVVKAIRERSIQLAGKFSEDQIGRLKQDLIDAVSGDPISRKELEKRIMDNLQVAKLRSEVIASTELGYSYNTGRIQTAQQSELVTHFRYISVIDRRTSAVCLSRNGLVFPVDQVGMYRPPAHPRCRSIISPLLPEVNPLHQEMVNDPGRDPANRTLTPLPKGWQL